MLKKIKEWQANRELVKMFKPAKGKYLDNTAELYAMKRIVYWWVFKESDKAFRKRIKQMIQKPPK